jgi:hypothetical protein
VSAAYGVGRWVISTIEQEDEPMAFTRYWVRPKVLEAKSFAKFSAACEKACKKFPGKLVDAVFTGDVVRFGAEPGWFVIERVSSDEDLDGEVFDFCKTCRYPYDAIVARCLTLLKEHFPEVTVTTVITHPVP